MAAGVGEPGGGQARQMPHGGGLLPGKAAARAQGEQHTVAPAVRQERRGHGLDGATARQHRRRGDRPLLVQRPHQGRVPVRELRLQHLDQAGRRDAGERFRGRGPAAGALPGEQVHGRGVTQVPAQEAGQLGTGGPLVQGRADLLGGLFHRVQTGQDTGVLGVRVRLRAVPVRQGHLQATAARRGRALLMHPYHQQPGITARRGGRAGPPCGRAPPSAGPLVTVS
ncbi:hypothetical protein [Streptomyces sp. bgisy084]|uniref:hypothetical protein n=1 Tax=Streptomyces sp. bgisy084 TaxID=3413777 RepID=UPI003D70C778